MNTCFFHGGRISEMDSTCGETILEKWPKAAGKLQNQHFRVKTMGGMGGGANFSGSGGGPTSLPHPTRGNPG